MPRRSISRFVSPIRALSSAVWPFGSLRVLRIFRSLRRSFVGKPQFGRIPLSLAQFASIPFSSLTDWLTELALSLVNEAHEFDMKRRFDLRSNPLESVRRICLARTLLAEMAPVAALVVQLPLLLHLCKLNFLIERNSWSSNNKLVTPKQWNWLRAKWSQFEVVLGVAFLLPAVSSWMGSNSIGEK